MADEKKKKYYSTRKEIKIYEFEEHPVEAFDEWVKDTLESKKLQQQ